MANWGYSKENGPTNWGRMYPIATEGHRQSPINFVVEECEEDNSMSPIVFKSEPQANLSLENTGASWKLDYIPERSSLTGGPLTEEYQLVQMHAHWGKEQGRGSEHTLNGKMFDGELHLVHYNTAYGAFEDAVDKPDGLAVLGIFLQIGSDPHPEFAKITELLEKIKKKGENVEVEGEVDPTQLLPESDCYFTYPGSLTTPPLFESVTWMVFNTPITISLEQMEAMRSLLEGEDESCDCMVDNYRPVCSRGNRVVKRANI